MTKPQRPPRRQLSDFPQYVAENAKLKRLEDRERELRAELARESERTTEAPVDRRQAVEAILASEHATAARNQRTRDMADLPTWGDLALLKEAIAEQRNRVGSAYSISAAQIVAELKPEYRDLICDIDAAIAHLEEVLDMEVAFHVANKDVRPWNYGCPRLHLHVAGKISQWRREAIDADILNMSLIDFYELNRERETAEADAANIAN